MDIGWNFECVEFLKVIAKGFNPITGEKLSEVDILRACDVAGRLEDLARELEKDYFAMSANVNSEISDDNAKLRESIEVREGLTLSDIAKNISKVFNCNAIKIKNILTKFLIEAGYLKKEYYLEQRRPTMIATEAGKEIGIENITIKYLSGNTSLRAVYSIKAQKFIFEFIPTIFTSSK